MTGKVLRFLLVAAVVVGLVFGVRAWRARAQVRIDNSLNVPILMSPAVQPGNGQSLLFKVTNVSGQPVGVTLTLFNDTDGKPFETFDFPKIPARVTMTRLYTPPSGTLVLNDSTFDAPVAVRALVGPLQGGEPGAIRNVVASLQMIRLTPAAAKAAPQPLDPPMLVPLERCLFKPRGMYPYTGAIYLWDCSPGI